MLLLNIVMLFMPPFLAWCIHGYINKDRTLKSKIWQGIGYFLVINAMSYGVSYVRGIKKLSFSNMTVSYRMKFCLIGCVFGILLPLIIHFFKKNAFIWKGLKNDIKSFVKDMRKYFRYAVRVAKADLRTEVANSYLDWLWWLIEPFCMMLIYAFVYGVVFRTTEQYFTAFIFIGLTMWSFFSRNLVASVSMVRMSKAIISKVYIPKYILLFSKMLVNGFKMLISFGIVVIMMIAYRIPVTYNVLFAVPILIDLFLISFALGVVLMHYGVFVRDLSYIIDILLRMMMYMTGTFYSLAKRVPAPYGEIIEKVNPIAYLIAEMRNALLYGTEVSWRMMVGWALLSVLILILGISTIYRNENAYVKVI